MLDGGRLVATEAESVLSFFKDLTMSDLSQLKAIAETHSALLESTAELKERLISLERRAHDAGDLAGMSRNSRSTIGAKFASQFEQHRDMFAKTKSLRLEVKAAADLVSTSSGRNIQSGGVGAIGMNALGFQNAMTVRPVPGVTAVEYSRMTGTQGAAAVQASEGAAKAAVRPDHTLITQGGLTIAGYTRMSRQALSDSVELKNAIDTTLMRSVGTALDVALVNGAAGFSGGFEGLATAYTSLVYTSLVDAISEGVATMQTAGFMPDVVAMSPADWLALCVAKSALDDHYLSGSYLGALPSEMRGLRVVLSPSVDTGKGLLLDSMHAELLVVDDFQIELGYENDDFTKNQCVILGEMRVIPKFITTGAARLITPKAA